MMIKRIDTRDLKRVIKRLAKEAHIDEKKAYRITNQVFKVQRVKLANIIRNDIGLPLVQAKKRIRLSRGRPRSMRNRWKYVALSTGGQALKVHAGRLSPKLIRRRGGGVKVQNKEYPGAFFWHPKGKILKGAQRRVYIRKSSGDIQALAGKPRISSVYQRVGVSMLNRATTQIINRIRREAMFR